MCEKPERLCMNPVSAGPRLGAGHITALSEEEEGASVMVSAASMSTLCMGVSANAVKGAVTASPLALCAPMLTDGMPMKLESADAVPAGSSDTPPTMRLAVHV